MNELSWLIYLADIAGTAKTLGLLALVGSGVVSVGMGAIGAVNVADAYGKDEEAQKSRGYARVNTWKKLWPVALAGAIVMVVFPSTQTLYAIAASELGESVIKSETGGKAVDALNAWLDKQISPPPAQ